MGLIDRAFGADQLSQLKNRLSLHWRIVAKNYENALSNPNIDGLQNKILEQLQDKSLQMADIVLAAKSGVSNLKFDVEKINGFFHEIISLDSELTVPVNKPRLLKEVMTATTDILKGNIKLYLRNNLWISE